MKQFLSRFFCLTALTSLLFAELILPVSEPDVFGDSVIENTVSPLSDRPEKDSRN